MNKKAKMFIAAFMALTLTTGLATSCGEKNSNSGSTAEQSDQIKHQEVDVKDAVKRENFESVYEKIGIKVSADMVTERDGKAFATVDGKEYELGMDFLSMAMVYNMKTSEKFPTKDDVYNYWWKLYIQRWNYLVPEVPLYSNQYFDIFNAKIDKLETTPYYSPVDAIVGSKVLKGENKVILGSNTDLSGDFRVPAFGKGSPGASDLDINKLTTGYQTVVTNPQGALQWADETIVKSHSEEKTAEGTLVVTIEIANDLKFSDGSAITAKNYVADILSGSSPVYAEASGAATAGQNFIGFDEFSVYDGTNNGQEVGENEKVTANKIFKGVRLLSDTKFSVEIIPDYADYYYSLAYSSFAPSPLKLYLTDGVDIKDDGQGCYLTDNFYEKKEVEGKKEFAKASEIKANVKNNNADEIPFSGPYIVTKYDAGTKTATLKKNNNYKGDFRGDALIETISYVKIVSETQLDQLKTGVVDVLAGITGGDDTKAALKIVKAENSNFKENHYDRAGYGKLAFRCDFGPTQFPEVRQAVMHTIDRTAFAQTFTGGYGSVVNGPYYTGSAAYIANKDELNKTLNEYAYNSKRAVKVLENGGWIYNEDGQPYTSGIRYKKLSGYELSEANILFSSKDNKYKTVKVNDNYYMPLVINWMGTQPNPVTDLLVTSWQKSKVATEDIGMYITYASGEFGPALYGEYLQMPQFGFAGKPMTGAVNFATGFNSAIYDFSYNWTIDPDKFSVYSNNFVLDEADFFNK